MKPLKVLAVGCVFFLYAPSVHANVVSTGTQNFNTTTSGLDFLTVQSSETLKPGILNLGVFLNVAINSLPYIDTTPQGRTNFNDTLWATDFNFGLGLTSNWEFGVSIPFVIGQTVSADTDFRGEFAKVGNTEIRINTKYRLLGDDSGGLAVIGSVNFDRIVNNPYKGIGGGPGFNLEFAYDREIHRVALGVNVGYRFTNSGTTVPGAPIEPFRNLWIVSLAGSYLFSGVDTKLISEIFLSLPARDVNPDLKRTSSSAEWIIGAKHDLSESTALHAGLGTQLINGISSPDWRVYVGLNHTLGPLWSKPKNEWVPVVKTEEDTRGGETFRLVGIQFDHNSDQLRSDSIPILDEAILQIRNRGKFTRMVVEGHTDSVGAEAYNQDLSRRRAETVMRYVIEKGGFPAEKLSAEGYGERLPISDNGNFQGRQENRRVEFRFF